MASKVLVWFRLDLRLTDNPALNAAHLHQKPIIPVFIWSPEEEGDWSPGAASRWWLHQSLKSLQGDLLKMKSRLIIRQGPSERVLSELIRETGAQSVYWNRRYEPVLTERDTRLKTLFTKRGMDVQNFNSALLFEPWTLRTQAGKPFQVFTPFWRACLSAPEPPKPTPAPSALARPDSWPKRMNVESLQLEPKIDWTGGFRKVWTPGEKGAHMEFKRFLEKGLTPYPQERDRPDHAGTSRLSPHLHFGEISPRTLWHAVLARTARTSRFGSFHGMEIYLKEIGWREFAHHLLFHFPHTPLKPLRKKFESFPWVKNSRRLKAWQRGRTGYPIVDAAMRELWATGWMHNRMRMVAASFLVKDLRISWLEGAKWFWDTLVDADLANNTLGWQWTAGCGADAAPYFRVFNPTLQGERFDPEGDYARRWVSELQTSSYPPPIVDHAAARQAALMAYKCLKTIKS